MKQRKLDKVFIWGFLFLYLLVATISFCHAVQFFNIGNVRWMSIVLAFSFELGLALSLAAILLSDKNKSKALPWILMGILTLVQVIGNVYSTFKYISLSEVEYYQYLAKPLLFFIEDVSEDTIQIIVSWIIGAILPIIALMMTDMVATNIKNTNDEVEEQPKEEPKKEEKKEEPAPVVEEQVKEEEKEEEKKEDEDNILSYMNDDGKPVWEEKQEEPKKEEKQSFATRLKNVFPSRKHVKQPTKVEPVRDAERHDSTPKRKANSYYFKGPEVRH